MLAGTDTAANAPNPNNSGLARVRVPFTASLNQAGPFTAELWAKPGAVGTISSPFNSIELGVQGWLIYQDNPTGQWMFRVIKAGPANHNINGGVVSSDWQHVVGVYDGTSTSLYVNGVLVAGPTPLGTTRVEQANPVIPIAIGARGDGASGAYGYNGCSCLKNA